MSSSRPSSADVMAGQLWVEYVALLQAAVEPSMMPQSAPNTACREGL